MSLLREKDKKCFYTIQSRGILSVTFSKEISLDKIKVWHERNSRLGKIMDTKAEIKGEHALELESESIVDWKIEEKRNGD